MSGGQATATSFHAHAKSAQDEPQVITALKYGCAILAWPLDTHGMVQLEVVGLDQPRFRATAAQDDSSRYRCQSQSLCRLDVGEAERQTIPEVLSRLVVPKGYKHHYTPGFVHGALRAALETQGRECREKSAKSNGHPDDMSRAPAKPAMTFTITGALLVTY